MLLIDSKYGFFIIKTVALPKSSEILSMMKKTLLVILKHAVYATFTWLAT